MISPDQKWLPRAVLLFSVFIVACASKEPQKLHTFNLIGGHFYGPGPVVPDTVLPPGELRNIVFSLEKFQGYAAFYNDGSDKAVLSDGKTRINQNIDAGILPIGGGDNTVQLVAVKGGPNKGKERYYLTPDYAMQWNVDLALDPGFAEGIVRVDQFVLTTGLIRVAQSVQTEMGMPGGYDQAGTLASGAVLAGRLGDFNQDGYLDGIVVAGPRVPIESQMMPGSPVGNQRGFVTDVAIPAQLACELTLRSIMQFKPMLAELMVAGDVAQTTKLLHDIKERIDSAQRNLDTALINGDWSLADLKQQGFMVSDRMESLKTFNFISISLIEHYPTYGGKFSKSAEDAVAKMFAQTEKIIASVAAINKETGKTLPQPKMTAL